MSLRISVATAIIAFAALTGSGQGNCKAGSLSFPCPKDFVIEKNGKTFIAIASDSKSKVGLYAFELKKKEKDAELISKGLGIVFKELFSAKSSEVEIKESPDYWGTHKYSLFEEAKFAKVAFSSKGKEFIHLHYLILAFQGKRLLLGFTDVMAKGDRAEPWFREWRGGGGDGDDQLQKLVISITKEEMPKDTPGGPPPAAPRKKPN